MSKTATLEDALDQRGFYVTPSAVLAPTQDVYSDLDDMVAFRGSVGQIWAWLRD